jgi:uncharacterized protein Yka (UPF0111/DUF47 family)
MKSFSLLPRQDGFYTSLLTLSAQAAACAHLLRSYVESDDAEISERIIAEIANCRAQSKNVMSELTGDLCRSFITPFDREDIQNFSQHLYRIPKMIEKVVQRMELHGLTGAEEDFARQTAVINDEAKAMEDIIHDLIHQRNTKKVLEKVGLLHGLEQKGDDVLQELLASLFTGDREVKDLLLRKDIYDMMEKIIDSYRNAANVALEIVLKYS